MLSPPGQRISSEALPSQMRLMADSVGALIFDQILLSMLIRSSIEPLLYLSDERGLV
jgi:hypothetical protein